MVLHCPIAVSCAVWYSPPTAQVNAVTTHVGGCSAHVPTQGADLQHAQTELEAVLLSPRPASCSTTSPLGENYRLFSKRPSSPFPIRFLASHPGCWAPGESVPNTPLLGVRLGWRSSGFRRFLHPPSHPGCIYLSRPGSVIRGNRSQDASPTLGS